LLPLYFYAGLHRLYIKNEPSALSRFQAMIDKPDFRRDLETAIKDPLSPIAAELVKVFTDATCIIKPLVKDSDESRKKLAAIGFAQARQTGAYNQFVTIAPDPFYNPLRLRFCLNRASSNESFPSCNPGSTLLFTVLQCSRRSFILIHHLAAFNTALANHDAIFSFNFKVAGSIII
jgi:hypothetical protein